MVFVETYTGEDRKQHSRTVKRIGYVDEFESQFSDPIAHFRQVAKQETLKIKEKDEDSMITFEIKKDEIMKFEEESDSYNIMVHYGDVFLCRLFHLLGLDKFMDARRKNLKDEYNLTNLLKLFIYERILNPASKLGNWKNRGDYYEKMNFSQSQIYSGLQRIGQFKEAILSHLDLKMKELYDRKSGFSFFDGTNVYYEIEDEDGFRMKGVSKENRSLPLTQLGVLLDSNGLPMSYDIWPGNTNDSNMLPKAMNRAKDRFGLKHMIYVADKGFYSGDTIAKAIINHDGYVIANSVRGTKIDEDTRKLVLDNTDYICIGTNGEKQEKFDNNTQFMYKTINTVSNRNVTDSNGKKHSVKSNKFMIAFWSKKYCERAKIDRMETIEKAINKSHTKSKSKIDNSYGSNRFLSTEITDSNGKKIEDYSATVKFDTSAVEEVEKLDGYYLIETNLAGIDWFEDKKPFDDGQDCRWRSDWGMLQLNRKLTPLDIIDIYRGLWKIEDSFRIMKSYLKMRPVFVWTKESIEGHFLICFLSLLFIRLLEIDCKGKYTTSEITKSLRKAMLAEVSPGKYVTTYYDKVLMTLNIHTNLQANQKAYTQRDLQKLFARSKKTMLT